MHCMQKGAFCHNDPVVVTLVSISLVCIVEGCEGIGGEDESSRAGLGSKAFARAGQDPVHGCSSFSSQRTRAAGKEAQPPSWSRQHHAQRASTSAAS